MTDPDDPNAFGSLLFVSQMAALFTSCTKLLDDLIKSGIPKGLHAIQPLLHAIAEDCRATLLLEKAQLLNQTILVQRALIERIINTCYLVAGGAPEQARYLREPVVGTAGLPGGTPEEIVEAARQYDPSSAAPVITPNLHERLDVIQRELDLPKDSFLVPVASVFSSASQILAGSLYGQVFHLGLFQRSAESRSAERISAHIREEFCFLFLTDIGLLDSMFKAIGKRHKIEELCNQSSALFCNAAALMKGESNGNALQLSWADGAWERLGQLEFSAERKLGPPLEKFEEAFRSIYEAGLIVTVLKARGPHLDLRTAALLLKRVLNDLRGVWVLLETGYTSQAASIAASLYESALASICLTLSQENIDKMLNNAHGEIPWSITGMAKMVVRSEMPSSNGPRFENAWRALYANYVWLCQIKHASLQSVLHDTSASSTGKKSYAVMAIPNTKEEDLVAKAHVALSALLRTQDAINAFATALGHSGNLPTQYAFAARMERARATTLEAFAPYMEKAVPVDIRRSRFTKKYPPLSV